MVWLENLLLQFSLLWCMHVLLRHGLVWLLVHEVPGVLQPLQESVVSLWKLGSFLMCSYRKFILPPQKGLEFPGGVGGPVRPKI